MATTILQISATTADRNADRKRKQQRPPDAWRLAEFFRDQGAGLPVNSWVTNDGAVLFAVDQERISKFLEIALDHEFNGAKLKVTVPQTSTSSTAPSLPKIPGLEITTGLTEEPGLYRIVAKTNLYGVRAGKQEFVVKTLPSNTWCVQPQQVNIHVDEDQRVKPFKCGKIKPSGMVLTSNEAGLLVFYIQIAGVGRIAQNQQSLEATANNDTANYCVAEFSARFGQQLTLTRILTDPYQHIKQRLELAGQHTETGGD